MRTLESPEFDSDVRLSVYRHFVRTGEAPMDGGGLLVGRHRFYLSDDLALPVGRGCRALARVWYLDRLDPRWRRRTAAEAQAVFGELGLTDPFWNLAGPPAAGS